MGKKGEISTQKMKEKKRACVVRDENRFEN